MKRKLLLFISTVLISSFGIAQTNTTCNPNSANYNTGSSDGSAFTQTSLIRTESSNTERGWARFNTAAIPDGDDINSVELHIYVSDDNWAYFRVMSIETDPLLGTAASVFTDCGDGSQYAQYDSDFPDPGWYVVDLGSQAASDLKALLSSDWFGVGLYEYESYSGYYLEYDGWNETNPPYIIVSHNPPPACPDPTAQIETNLTATGADLGWTENGSASTWEIMVDMAGFDTTGYTHTITTANPYSATGLAANTSYDWYVRASCGGGDYSAWIGPSTFTTACNSASLPWSEGFESMGTYGGSSIPDCMAKDGGWVTANSSQSYNRDAHSGSAYVYTNWDADDWLFTPSFDLTAGTSYDFTFWYVTDGNSGWTTVEAKYGTGQTSSDMTTTIGTPISGPTNTTYESFTASFTPASSGTYYLSIHVVATSAPWYITFDDLMVEETPSCPAPTGLTASDETTTTVRLAWNPATGGTGYDWEIVPLDNAQGSGVITSGNVADTTVVASGLTSGTTYDLYVRTDCGSTYTGPLHFSTACDAKITSFPYTSDFENAGSIPNCWTNDPSDAGGEWEFTQSNSRGSSSDHTSGSGYYALLNDFSVTTSNSPFNLLTPIFDLSTHNKWYKVSYWAWIGPDGASNPIYFEVSLDGGTTWETLYTHDHSTTGSWFNVSIDLGFKKSDNVVFRFKGVSVWGYNTDNSGIDDFTIEETQAPPVPLSDWAIYIGIFFILLFMVVAYKRRLA